MSAKNILTAAQIQKINVDNPTNQLTQLGDRLADSETEGAIYVDCAGAGPWPFTMPYDGDITDALVHCNAAHATGTLQLQLAAGTAISDAMVCAVNDVVTRAASLVAAAGNGLHQGDGLKIVSANSAEGRVTINIRKR